MRMLTGSASTARRHHVNGTAQQLGERLGHGVLVEQVRAVLKVDEQVNVGIRAVIFARD